MMKAAAALAVFALSLVTACPAAPATPTPTPEPTATQVEVLATEAKHLEGIWWSPRSDFAGHYFRFNADGTLSNGYRVEVPEEAWWEIVGRFWFEDRVYYEGDRGCPVGSYRVYLEVEGRMVVRFRFEEIDDRGAGCEARRGSRTRGRLVRVD